MYIIIIFYFCSDPFRPGDSGSLIYIKNKSGKRWAIAILKGARHKPEEHIYDAILLQPAMVCLEEDYKHLVKSLTLYTGRQSLNGHNPSSGPVPVTTGNKTQCNYLQ